MLRLGKFSRTGPGLNSWPVLSCFALGVLLPSAALLWFMSKAIQNERVAVSQRLHEGYRSQIPFLQQELAHFWLNLSNRAVALQAEHANSSPAVLFHAALETKLAQSALVLSKENQIVYPNSPTPVSLPITTSPEWMAAARLEETDAAAAARAYASIANRRPNPVERAPALLAQARSLQRAAQPESAIRILRQLTEPEFQDCVDPSGRLISPNADLALLELSRASSPEFAEISTRLAARLNSYSHPDLSSSQRRFLMAELRRLNPSLELPALDAEQLSAEYLAAHPSGKPLQSTAEIFAFRAANLLLLFHRPALQGQIASELQTRLPPGLQLALVSPGEEALPGAIATARAGPEMPGWKIALHVADSTALQTLTSDQISSYLWTGILVLAAMGIITVISARLLTRQIRVARLKNDLVANVTHELKTPLASIRLLVDTLLHQSNPDPKTTREYLELISRENSRLTRVVENFLAFSRMERNKHSFDFHELDPAAIARSAADALQEKFAAASSCQFRLELAPDLPHIRGDADSLVTALINLLENAFKYSGDNQHITLRAAARDSTVLFEVTDQGMGIPAADLQKIFRRFYQVDPSLSRRGSGCGLGLSIVDFIVRSHGGTIQVESEPGRGSTFRILLPALVPSAPERDLKEAACA